MKKMLLLTSFGLLWTTGCGKKEAKVKAAKPVDTEKLNKQEIDWLNKYEPIKRPS